MWVEAVTAANRNFSHWKLSPWMKICSAHFLLGRKSLARKAVNFAPTIFPDNALALYRGSRKNKEENSSSKSCCVIGCQAVRNDSKMLLYNFPEDDSNEVLQLQRRKWIEAVTRANIKVPVWKFDSQMLICSSHFVMGAKSLSPQALNFVPTLFPNNDISKVGQNKGKKGMKRPAGSEMKTPKGTEPKVPKMSLDVHMEKPTQMHSGLSTKSHGTVVQSESKASQPTKRVTRRFGYWEELKANEAPVEKVTALLQALWNEKGSMDMSIVSSDKKVIKCHALMFSLISNFASELVQDAVLKGDDELCLHLPHVSCIAISSLLEKVYCVNKSDLDSQELSFLACDLKIERSGKAVVDTRVAKQNDNASQFGSLEHQLTLVRNEDAFKIKPWQSLMTAYKNTEEAGQNTIPISEETKSSQKTVQSVKSASSQKTIQKRHYTSKPKMIKVDAEEVKQESDESDDSDNESDNESDEPLPAAESVHIHGKDPDDPELIVHCSRCAGPIKTTKSTHQKLVEMLEKKQPGKKVHVQYQCPKCYPKNGQPLTAEEKKGKNVCSTCQQLHPGPDAICSSCLPKSSMLCPQCGQKFKSARNLQYHINWHNGVFPYQCESCGLKSHSKFTIWHHQKNCGDRAVKICDSCPEPETPHHRQLHHDPALEFSCKECSYKAGSPHFITAHAAKYHKDKGYDNRIQCSKCPSLIKEDVMNSHMKNHHDENLPFSCDKCLYRGLTKGSIKTHQTLHHRGNKAEKERIPCEGGCGKTFTQIPYMRWHMKRFCVKSSVRFDMKKREDECGIAEKQKLRRQKYKERNDKLREDIQENTNASKD